MGPAGLASPKRKQPFSDRAEDTNVRAKTLPTLIVILGTILGAGSNLYAQASCNDPFPPNERMRYNCDISSASGTSTASGTLRSRVDMYNTDDLTDAGCFCVIQFQEAFSITLTAPIELIGVSRCQRTNGITTGTRIYGGCDNDDNAQVVIDARSFTQEATSRCAFELAGGLDTRHQIRDITIKVGRRDKAICDEDGVSILDATTENCGGGLPASECEFGGVTVDVPGGVVDCGDDLDDDRIGEACDDFPGDTDNDGTPNMTDLCPTVPGPAKTNLKKGKGGAAQDTDGDLNADICDPDDDDDNVIDGSDNCPLIANAPKMKKGPQADEDGDGLGDACDDDGDNDTIPDDEDNCPEVANINQANADGLADGGNACDPDDDEDGLLDVVDNCQFVANPTQDDADGDGFGDLCDGDDDNDGVLDISDICLGTSLGTAVVSTTGCPAADNDGDGLSDSEDPDDDNDSLPDDVDNCAGTANPGQENTDLDIDGGDACDLDDDNDGILDGADNCPLVANTDQINSDGLADGGNACDPDDDEDGLVDTADNCPTTPNPAGTDTDGDGIGDACEVDSDLDGTVNDNDNCTFIPNSGQEDEDGDGVGDACEFPDADGDRIPDPFDLCPTVSSRQGNVDGDLLGDECDPDADADGRGNETDNCVLVANPGQADGDGDGIGDLCEGSPFVTDTDDDGVVDFFDCAPTDGTRDSILECFGDQDADGLSDVQEAERGTDPLRGDTDDDGVMDVLDCSPLDEEVGVAGTCDGAVRLDLDPDGDGIGLGDNCPFVSNETQRDTDGDGFGDSCDPTADEVVEPSRDTDADGKMDAEDNCLLVPNADQLDSDGDGRGDRCEGDFDGDGVPDAEDNCGSHFNPDQSDEDKDNRGDPCDEDFVPEPSGSVERDGGGCSLIPKGLGPRSVTVGNHVSFLWIGLLSLARLAWKSH